jgi:hypothetical protein
MTGIHGNGRYNLVGIAVPNVSRKEAYSVPLDSSTV